MLETDIDALNGTAPPRRVPGTLRRRLGALAIAAPTLLALAAIFDAVLTGDAAQWPHLREYVLPAVLVNTLWLLVGVSTLTAVLGTALAWLTAVCEFPGRRVLDWALLLPLAIPGYVLAFVYIGLLDYAGPLRTALRDSALGDGWMPEIRSRAGVIFVLTLALYPYVYLLARNAFLSQGRRMLEVAQSLGLTHRQGFIRAALPLARPWILAGVSLVAMDTLADFGTVAVFNYDTFTTAIYKTWFGLFSVEGALQLSACLLVLVFIAVLIEQRVRDASRYTQVGGGQHPRYRLRGVRALLATAVGGLVLAAGFLIPVAQLCSWALDSLTTEWDARYPAMMLRSLLLSGMGALTIVVTAVALAFLARHGRDRATRLFTRLATLGYALPGTVLAIGIFAPIAALSDGLSSMLSVLGLPDTRIVLQNSLIVVLVAYLVRFMAVAYRPISSSLLRIGPSIEDAARNLGATGGDLLRRVYVPMLGGGIATAALLVFVELMKEMPITLMTRPFGWDTLAVRIFELTSEGEWQRAALPALSILAAGLAPVILLIRRSER